MFSKLIYKSPVFHYKLYFLLLESQLLGIYHGKRGDLACDDSHRINHRRCNYDEAVQVAQDVDANSDRDTSVEGDRQLSFATIRSGINIAG